MLKYCNTEIAFQEVPDEISLIINLTRCPHECPNCHSPQLRLDIGKRLTKKEIDSLIKLNKDASCVCFMGGDNDHDAICEFAKYIHEKYPLLKVAMYSGDNAVDLKLIKALDYYKVGSYIESKGPLNSRTTNQVFYKITGDKIEDITKEFQRKSN